MRINPIGAVGSADSIRSLQPIKRNGIFRVPKEVPARAAFYSALESYSNNTHLKSYLDLAGRKYEANDMGECFLGRKYSKLFEADVIHMVAKYWSIISIQAVLLKTFTTNEKDKMKEQLININLSDTGATFVLDYKMKYPDYLYVVKEICSTDVNSLLHFKKMLDIPLKVFFDNEESLFDCLQDITD